MQFRHDLNLLRALAVSVVTLYHFDLAGIHSGLIGVDLFFVVSGYLMTQILLAPTPPSYAAFILARCRRILPALLVLCLALLVYGWWRLDPPEYLKLAKYSGTSLLFVSNFIYNNEAGYFDATAVQKWLLHTWSLSVEWQFYLLYPLLLLGLRQRSPRWVLSAGLMLLGFFSVAALIFWPGHKPSNAFYLLPWRAWEMLAGTAAYFVCQRCVLPMPWRTLGQSVLLLACLLCALFLPHTPWPSPNTLWVVFLAAAFVALGPSNLDMPRWVHVLGLWSYSIYLWHWPIWVWLNQHYEIVTPALRWAGVAASVLLGALSYRWIETPFRQRPALRPWLWVGLILCVVACLLIIAAKGVYQPRFPAERQTRAAEWFAFERNYQKVLGPYYQSSTCFVGENQQAPQRPAFCVQASHRVLLAGDSHAAHLWWGLHQQAGLGGLNHMTASGCAPIRHAGQSQRCANAYLALQQQLRRHDDGVVVLAAYWYQLLQQTSLQQLEAELAILRQINPRATLVLVGSVPIYKPSLLANLAREWLQSGAVATYSRVGIRPATWSINQDLARIAQQHGLRFFDPAGVLCRADACLRLTGPTAVPVQWDYGHLTAEGSLLLGQPLGAVIQNILRGQ